MHSVRPYGSSDFQRLARIHDPARRQELVASRLEAAFIPFKHAAEREGLFDYTVLVAENQERVDGFVAFDADELAWLYVDPARQRQGIGKLLVGAVLERAKQAISVEVLVGNSGARQFYQKAGFACEGTVDGVMHGNESFQVCAWIMVFRPERQTRPPAIKPSPSATPSDRRSPR